MADDPKFVSRILVANQSQSGMPRAVYVEPWRRDYTLLAGEELEISAFGREQAPWFGIVEWDGETQVYCEEACEAVVR
jgi:hypothetical protein